MGILAAETRRLQLVTVSVTNEEIETDFIFSASEIVEWAFRGE
jgi:hypothetical protein